MDFEYDKQNQKIIDMLANLSKRGGEDPNDTSLPILPVYTTNTLFPEEYYTSSNLTDEEKQNRSPYLVLKDFLLAKKLEGCSLNTIKGYHDALLAFLVLMNPQRLIDVTTTDIRNYLNYYYETRNVNHHTLDTLRRVFSSFFDWLQQEDYIIKNPVKKIKRIKINKTVKKAFSDEEIVMIKDACKKRTLRDICIIDFLYSSGVRVSELCGLNINDIDLKEREGIVFGKGAKERTVYFDASTKIHLEQYLSERYDDNPALFVSLRYPFKRIHKNGVELLVREIGQQAGVDKCYPHRFRRTLATNLINKGVPIEQVQQILGHTKIDTTLIYAIVNQDNVKLNHKKYI